MLLAELYYVRWLVRALLQVPYRKVFAQVDGEELAESCWKLLALVRGLDIRYVLLVRFAFSFGRLGASSLLLVIEVQLTPLYLRDGALCFLVPHGQRTRELFVIHTKQKHKWDLIKNFVTYHIDPQEKAANRKPLSHSERAVGEFNPMVSIFCGSVRTSSLRCILKRPRLVEKK